MTIIIILIVLFVIYLIGKYISASNKDAQRQNTAQFGEKLSSGAKNVGCFITSITIIGIVLFLVLVLKILFAHNV